jgi:hypothetical protein
VQQTLPDRLEDGVMQTVLDLIDQQNLGASGDQLRVDRKEANETLSKVDGRALLLQTEVKVDQRCTVRGFFAGLRNIFPRHRRPV